MSTQQIPLKVISVLQSAQTVDVATVNTEIERLWTEARTSPAAREAALRAGLPPERLDDPAAPVRAGRNQEQIGIATAIAIFVASHAAGKVIERAVDAAWESKVWKEYFWPRIRASFGAKLKPLK
jgi:hypothetical protein